MEKNVNESSITRLMRHNEEHDCVCITAYRSNREKDDYGVHKRKARVSNQKANAALGAVLRRYGYNVTKVVGKYPEEDGQADVKENSWFVVNVNDDSDFVDVCADLAEADEQDSILVMPKGSFSTGKGCYLYGTNPNGSWPKYHEKKMTDGISVNGDSPFETRISGKRYSFNVVDESGDDKFWNPSSMFGAMARHAYIKNHYGLDFFNIANETSRFQKAKKAFLGQMKNIRNFAIITPENPMGVASTSTENSALCEKFENSLKSGHYLFYKVRGKFNGNLEHSYMVFNVQLEQVKKWACESEFNQQSFFFCESQYDEVNRKTGVKFNYWSRKPGKKNAFELIESTLEWIDFTNMDSEFTAIGRNFKFSIPLQCFMETANSKYENAKKNMKSDMFEMCFNEALSNRGFNGWASRGRIMKSMKQQKINETIDGSIKNIIQLKTLDNSLEYSQMFDALEDCPKDFQTKLIQVLNSVSETIQVSPIDVFNIVLCASNKENDKDVVKKMYNWWKGVFEILSKCDVPDDRKKEYDDLVDALMAEVSKSGGDAKINESEEYGYEQADIEDEDAMLKDMKFAISKIGEIANRVQDLINFVNPYCQSFNEDKNMKFKKINENGGEFVPPELFECDGVEYKIEPEKNPTFPEGDYAILEWEDGEYKYKCRHMGAYDVKMWMNNMRKDENRRREERILRQRYKKNESKDGEWIDMDDLIGVPQSDPRDDDLSSLKTEGFSDFNDDGEDPIISYEDEDGNHSVMVVSGHDEMGDTVYQVKMDEEEWTTTSNLKEAKMEARKLVDKINSRKDVDYQLMQVNETSSDNIDAPHKVGDKVNVKGYGIGEIVKVGPAPKSGSAWSDVPEVDATYVVRFRGGKTIGGLCEPDFVSNKWRKTTNEANVVQNVTDVWELLKVLEDDEAASNLKSLIDSHVRSGEEIMDAIDELYPEDVTQIELNNAFASGMEEIVDALGLDVDAYMEDGSFVDTLKPSRIASEGNDETNPDEVKGDDKKFKGDDGEVKTLDNAGKKVVSEMTVEQEIDDPWKLSEMMWGQGQENLQELLRSDVVGEEEVMQMIEDMGIRDLTSINDAFAYDFQSILESLGLDGKAWSNNLEIKRKDDDDYDDEE